MFVESRLASLASWLDGDSGRELGPAQAGALVLARLVEILPFEDANGRISRLAASHVMVARRRAPAGTGRGGPRAPSRAPAERAFQFDTEPLVGLLQEASERALDVMLQALEREL